LRAKDARRGDRLLRDQVGSLGFEAVFAELSRQGYKEFEFAGYSALLRVDWPAVDLVTS
jgi:hypothetical protein